MIKVLPQLTSWSFSRYSDYKQCPAKAKYKHIDKLKEPPNTAMLRGLAVHKLAEDFVKGVLRKMPEELGTFSDDLLLLREWYAANNGTVLVEESWAFTRDWTATEWNNWNACYLRVKTDVAFYSSATKTVLTIVDWKTGRQRPEKEVDYVEQLELYVLAAFKLLPNVVEVRPWLAYADSGSVYPEAVMAYTREYLPDLEVIWARRIAPMMADTTFKPNPGNACTWCHFKKSNGGPCQF